MHPLSEALRIEPNDPQLINDLGVAHLCTGRIPEAIALLRRSLGLQPNWGMTHCNLGIALQHVGDEGGAMLAFRRAVALAPDHAKAHGLLADMLWDRGMRAEAAPEYERAAALAPGTVLGQLGKATALAAADRHGDAVEVLKQAIESGISDARIQLRLGQFLQEAGRFDEASATFERCIEAAPEQEKAYYGLVSSRRMTEADRPWIARIRSMLDEAARQTVAPTVAQGKRMLLNFAAGKALDDLGDYAEAMRHFHAANDAGKPLSTFNRDQLERLADQLIARFTPEFFAEHSALGQPDSTPILVVGMPRSGTTLLERILASHPGVRGCGELTFWGTAGMEWALAPPEGLAKVADRLRTDYLGELRKGAPDVLRATDKMPFNFFWVGLVHLLLPGARFVHSRRNPVDTCLSVYTTPLAAAHPLPRGLEDLAWYYRLYRRLMDHWHTVVPEDRLIDADYEDVVSDREATARRLIAFAGLEWDAACLRPEDNRDAVRTASQWQARQPVYRSSVERWRRYEPWIGELMTLL
jgi:tetratricopeptide (TPR) repeat protein